MNKTLPTRYSNCIRFTESKAFTATTTSVSEPWNAHLNKISYMNPQSYSLARTYLRVRHTYCSQPGGSKFLYMQWDLRDR
jgi:hypothetical protein